MRAAIGIGVVTILAICVHGCGKTPAGPTTTNAPPSPVPIAIRLSGPTTLAPGTTGRFTAVAERSDGSAEDVTATASWSILWSGPDRNRTGTNVLRVVGGGEVAAVAPGEASVNVQIPLQSRSPITASTINVLVLEPGTFRISGAVTSAAVPEAASIEILSGTGTGLRTIASTFGRAGAYALYGAAGDVQLRTSAEGFEPQTRRLVVTDNLTSDFDLKPLSAPTDVSGSWRLTMSASNSCRAALPEAAWQREFDATISQEGTHFRITLASPTLYDITRSSFEGRVFGQTISFIVVGDTCYGDWSDPDLFDALSPTEWLGITGSVQGTAAGSEIRATLDSTMCGAFDVWQSGTGGRPAGPPQAVCHAKDSMMVLRRK